jgi:hypothetical protein
MSAGNTRATDRLDLQTITRQQALDLRLCMIGNRGQHRGQHINDLPVILRGQHINMGPDLGMFVIIYRGQSRSLAPCCPLPNVSPGGVWDVVPPRGRGEGRGATAAEDGNKITHYPPDRWARLAGPGGSRHSARWPSRTDRPAAGPPLAGAFGPARRGSSSRLACAARRGLPRLPGRGMPSRAVLGQLGRQNGGNASGCLALTRRPVHHDRVGCGRPTRPTRSWSPTRSRAPACDGAPAIARAKPRSTHPAQMAVPVMGGGAGRRWPCSAGGRARRAGPWQRPGQRAEGSPRRWQGGALTSRCQPRGYPRAGRTPPVGMVMGGP